MNLSTFGRSLDDEFVRYLNDLYRASNSWWREFVDDKETFVAIRDNYVNVYYLGASLLKLSWRSSTSDVLGEVHYKYLVRSTRTRNLGEYANVRADGTVELPPNSRELLLDHLNVQELKAAAYPHAGEEKKGVHKIAQKDRNAVLDLEAAIREHEGVRQVDIVALVEAGDDTILRFFEAKAFNNPELRKGGSQKPDVLQQIERYSESLKRHRDAILASYRRVCANLHNLEGLGTHEAHNTRQAMIKAVVEGSSTLVLDDEPRLVVFNFDNDQRTGDAWRPHREKLCRSLKQRFRAWGDPADARLDWGVGSLVSQE